MDAEKTRRVRRITAAIVSCAVILAFMACFLIFFLGAISAEKPPIWVVLYFIVLPACVIIGVIIALMQRLREIKGGEEDAARKY